MRQAWLFPFPNPLATKAWEPFFAALPRVPGVYVMLGQTGAVLYVGKAKNLRARLQSYRRARPAEAARKTVRLVHQIRAIRWVASASERDALLTENRWLRELAPSFNRVNTRPQAYPFLALERRAGDAGDAEFRLRLVLAPGDLVAGARLYGCFKSRGLLARALGSLGRVAWCFWLASPEDGAPTGAATAGGEPPLAWMRDARDVTPWLALPAGFEAPALLEAFLEGRSSAWLRVAERRLGAGEHGAPAWQVPRLTEDLRVLRQVFRRAFQRHRRLLRQRAHRAASAGGPGLTISAPAAAASASTRERLIGQDEIDDLLVRG